MALFDGSLIRSIGQNILPVAAGFIGGTALGRSLGVTSTSTPAAATASAAGTTQRSTVQTAAEQTAAKTTDAGIMDAKVFGVPVVLIGVAALVYFFVLKK